MSLQADLKVPIRSNVPLSTHSTLKTGGPARYFAEPTSRDELRELLEFQHGEGCPALFLGRGSNLLFSDAGFDGLVISMKQFQGGKIVFEENSQLCVPASTNLVQLSMACQERGLGGAEFLCHIPGTVGGATVMNAGFGRLSAAWREMKDVIECVTVMLPGGVTETIWKEGLEFEYRKTHLPAQSVVLEVRLQLSPEDPAKIQQEITANFEYRNSVQDLSFPSAGSTFKNPKNNHLSSGQMLERVKMKGQRVGSAMVSEKHANFILNLGGACSEDVLRLMNLGRERVLQFFGVTLEPEVKLISQTGE
jgi:UDP-N-acetylmuramate dehydrogenase